MKRVAIFLALGAAGSFASAARLAPGTADVSSDVRPLPFVADDYARALAEARARGLPLFIEAWAPW
jgi:hypothetical protein